MNKKVENLALSLQTGFINKNISSLEKYRPKILLNDPSSKRKVLTDIISELNKCDEFLFSVAFLRMSGLACLIGTFQELEEKGIKGKILVSKYLNFTDPNALRRLLRFNNIQLKIGDFHSKEYLFKRGDIYNLIIGSSNLTADALCSNTEINLKVSTTKDSELISSAISQFENQFKSAITVDDAFIKKYEEAFSSEASKNYLINQKNIELKNQSVAPNKMQASALQNLELLRFNDKKKALIISATGTGKTFLCAFDVKNFKAKKFLFVVHRANIAHAAMRTFKTIFGNSTSMGFYSGNRREKESDFIFSTVQTISKQEHLEQFSSDHFDYIVIDETHRAGAKSYSNIINYFNPQFLLGMTATPERTDGADIYELFNHDIAYEIRLHDALNENMLCPFHYYGVTDITVNGELLNEKSDFNLLTSKNRIEHIIDRLAFYGCDDGKPKGLIFCSRNTECRELSDGFNRTGFKTIALSGKNTEEERKDAIRDLEAGNLEYIFTVDIFNEGIDIPVLNQIIMLRPTQSAIIFVQQLGRGLRKLKSKDYLTVIDFIGNYSNNYLIAIALHGDTSYNKDSLRKCMKEGILGPSTINFDKISKDRIFASIDSANMQTKKDLIADYNLLKHKIGRIPSMVDFISHGSRDPFLYVSYNGNKYKSYYNFICQMTGDLNMSLESNQARLLEKLSLEINNSKRVEDSLMLKKIITDKSFSIKSFRTYIFNKYGYDITLETCNSILNNINLKFIREKKDGSLLPVSEIYSFKIAKVENNKIEIDSSLEQALNNIDFKKYLLDSIEYSIMTFDRDYHKNKFISGFILYKKYSRKDVFRILNWDQNPVAQNVGGYMISPNKENCPIFVTYQENQYDDRFIDNETFEWESKKNRTLKSPDVSEIKNNKNLDLPLFVKKDDAEGSDFYFISYLTPINNSFKEVINKNGDRVVRIHYKLKNPIQEKLADYLCSLR
ncbi:MAG: restriction endonuclease subunit R [Candidatus Marinimicrobia bacterium]|nr:restriction endonuclease subunit R [Candidatus Neomarinimicrobiota bacterium]